MARKSLSLALVFVFSWLQTYQLCDASEDMIEDLPAGAQMAAGRHAFLSRPAEPDDEADAHVPQVFDQTLMPSSISLPAPLGLSRVLSLDPTVVLAPAIIAPAPRDLSPPARRLSYSHVLGYSNQTFVASVRSLAPPLA